MRKLLLVFILVSFLAVGCTQQTKLDSVYKSLYITKHTYDIILVLASESYNQGVMSDEYKASVIAKAENVKNSYGLVIRILAPAVSEAVNDKNSTVGIKSTVLSGTIVLLGVYTDFVTAYTKALESSSIS